MKNRLHRYTGSTHYEALLKANIDLGNVKIVRSRKIKTGGFFGLFCRVEHEIWVEPDSVNAAAAAAAVKQSGESRSTGKKKRGSGKKKAVKQETAAGNTTAPPDKENIRKILELIEKNKTERSRDSAEEKPQQAAGDKGRGPAVKPATAEAEDDVKYRGELDSLNREISGIRQSVEMMKKELSPVIRSGESALNGLPGDIADFGKSLFRHKVKREKALDICRGMLNARESRGGDFSWNLRDLFKEELQKLVSLRHFDIHQQDTIMFSLIGPTGSGKTTTIAKLASKWKMHHENLKMVFITLDTYRIGAVEHIISYHEILDVPLEICCEKSELDEAIRKYRHENYNLIIIDTAGRSPNNPKEISELCETLSAPDVDNYLVLCANSKERDMENIIKKFSHARPRGYIITKTDETRNYGFLVNLSHHFRNTPIYCITDGQDVQDDIIFPSYNDLAGMFFSDD